MTFLIGITKVVRTQIAHKSWNSSIIGNQLHF
jgi:hypothetical protein